MKFIKSLFFLVLVNAAIMLSIFILLFVLGLFGIHFSSNSLSGLFLFSAVIGFTGSFISLLMSKWIAKRMFNIKIINEKNWDTPTEKIVYNAVREMAEKAGLPMPEVGIYDGPANAFATGYSSRNSLVAVSTDLISQLDTNELKGVIAHEISHIKNGDMVTMTLMEGTLNTFVYFIANILTRMVEGDRERGFTGMFINLGFQILLGIFATMILMAFSRYREYKADEGSVLLNGRDGIYYALRKLAMLPVDRVALPDKMKAFGIVGFLDGLLKLFASHPPIEKRLQHIDEFSRKLQ